MNCIVVCIKQVPDATLVKIDPKTNTLDRSSAPAILNPYDAHAVQEAVNLKKIHGGKVIVITMGPGQAVDIIKKSIELGADEGVLMSDRVFAGSDTLATSYILSKGIENIQKQNSVKLIICGKQAIDGDTAQVGPGIAQRLRYTQLTYVNKIETLSYDANEIVVHRCCDNGHEVVKAQLPCVVTVEKDINELDYSALPSMIKAARYVPEVWGAEQIQPDPVQIGLKGSPTTVRKIFAPPERAGGEHIDGSNETSLSQLTSKLVEKL